MNPEPSICPKGHQLQGSYTPQLVWFGLGPEPQGTWETTPPDESKPPTFASSRPELFLRQSPHVPFMDLPIYPFLYWLVIMTHMEWLVFFGPTLISVVVFWLFGVPFWKFLPKVANMNHQLGSGSDLAVSKSRPIPRGAVRAGGPRPANASERWAQSARWAQPSSGRA